MRCKEFAKGPAAGCEFLFIKTAISEEAEYVAAATHYADLNPSASTQGGQNKESMNMPGINEVSRQAHQLQTVLSIQTPPDCARVQAWEQQCPVGPGVASTDCYIPCDPANTDNVVLRVNHDASVTPDLSVFTNPRFSTGFCPHPNITNSTYNYTLLQNWTVPANYTLIALFQPGQEGSCNLNAAPCGENVEAFSSNPNHPAFPWSIEARASALDCNLTNTSAPPVYASAGRRRATRPSTAAQFGVAVFILGALGAAVVA